MLVRLTNGAVAQTFDRPGFWRQLSTLLRRDAVVAVRDPTLYYLQVGPLVFKLTPVASTSAHAPRMQLAVHAIPRTLCGASRLAIS